MAELKQTALGFVERRENVRTAVELDAVGMLPEGQEAFSCQVLDMSASGARLMTTGSDIMPERFRLLVPERMTIFSCEMIWRSECEFGVRFTDIKAIDG